MYLCKADLDVWLKGKLLLCDATFPKLSFKQKKREGGGETTKTLGKAPPLFTGLWERGRFLCLATKTWGSVSKSAGLTSNLLW